MTSPTVKTLRMRSVVANLGVARSTINDWLNLPPSVTMLLFQSRDYWGNSLWDGWKQNRTKASTT